MTWTTTAKALGLATTHGHRISRPRRPGRGPVTGVAAALAIALAACTPRQAPLSDLERIVWATDVPDVIPRPPEIRALEGKPGHPDYERPRAKGRAVLRVIRPGAAWPAARAQLAARGFAITIDPAAGQPPVQWMSGAKTWCTRLKCCVTDVALELTAGRVTGALAYDYEYDRWLRAPTIQNSLYGKARCA